MAGVLKGKYVRKTGKRRVYEYSAQWNKRSWDALVRRNGDTKGAVGGNFSSGAEPDEKAVRALIESCIENLIQVRE